MSKITATRRLQYAIGHRVANHESKCNHLHGHNFVFFLTAEREIEGDLDSLGRVIDFGALKAKIGTWIEANWDHGFVLWKEDEAGFVGMTSFSRRAGFPQRVFYLDANPTAENLAAYLLQIGPMLLAGTGVRLTKVTVWETENGIASVEETP